MPSFWVVLEIQHVRLVTCTPTPSLLLRSPLPTLDFLIGSSGMFRPSNGRKVQMGGVKRTTTQTKHPQTLTRTHTLQRRPCRHIAVSQVYSVYAEHWKACFQHEMMRRRGATGGDECDLCRQVAEGF